MNEYNVSFFAPTDGSFVVDIHASTGTSPYVKFKELGDLLNFFRSLGINDERLAEVEKVCSGLEKGHAYHEQLFLPDSVIEAVEKLTAESGGTVAAFNEFRNGDAVQAQHA